MSHNGVSYTLTDTTIISCHGTSFKSIVDAKNYAHKLQQDWGICETFSIGEYTWSGHKEVYRSTPLKEENVG